MVNTPYFVEEHYSLKNKQPELINRSGQTEIGVRLSRNERSGRAVFGVRVKPK